MARSISCPAVEYVVLMPRLLEQDLLLPLHAARGGPEAAFEVALLVQEAARYFARLAGETPGIPQPIGLVMTGLPNTVLFALQAGPDERCLRFVATNCLFEGGLWMRLHAELRSPSKKFRLWSGRASMAASLAGLAAMLAGLLPAGLLLVMLALLAAVTSRLASGGVFEHDHWNADPALAEAAAALVARLAGERSGRFVSRRDFGY